MNIKNYILLVVILMAAGLRFVALDQKPLWCDELATVQRLGLSWWGHLLSMKGNHPLYEMLLRLWMPPDGSDIWLRIPSAALGVAAVYLTWRLLKQITNSAGLIGACLMAFSPLALMYSRIGRAYSLACVLALVSNLALLWVMRRQQSGEGSSIPSHGLNLRRILAPLAVYIFATTLLIYSNLFALSLWFAQLLFLLWFYRQRIKTLVPWMGATAAIGLLLLPWMLFSLPSATTWSVETKYTAEQFGTLAKLCYLPLTLCLGETVHPLNLAVVLPAFIAFGLTLLLGTRAAIAKSFVPTKDSSDLQRALPLFLLVQVIVILSFGLFFSSIAPKHLTILLPAWMGLIGIGLISIRRGWLRLCCMVIILITASISIANYFANRQFADADMVTPWRELANEAASAQPEKIIVGYRPDRGAYDMFRRYYPGLAQVEHLDFRDWRTYLTQELSPSRPTCLLLHDGDPWQEIESWLSVHNWNYRMTPFQEEEHTLRGLREGWRSMRKYRSPLYRLYIVTR